MSKWTRHKERWSNCEECSLCEHRTNVVLARGKIPCDVLFIGEAPGVSEDTLGQPFVGKAGKLLDGIIEESLPTQTRKAFTNLVGCIPYNEKRVKTKEPPEEAIKACGDRLEELVLMCRPAMIVLVGKLSAKWVPMNLSEGAFPEDQIACEIIHPAAILRMDISQQGFAIQRTEVTLRDTWESCIPF